MKTIAYIRATNIYNDARASKEILALAQQGYKVHVLGWNRSGNAKERCVEVFKEYDSRIEFHFLNIEIVNVGIKNIDKLFKWFRFSLKKLKEIQKKERIDAVHACDLDTGLIGLKFCKHRNSKLVYDIYDYYVDAHKVPKIMEYYIEKLETKVINHSDLTIICTEERKIQLEKATPKNVLVIHNAPEVKSNMTHKKEYDYVYCGTLGEGRMIKEFLDEYANNQDIKVAFGGFGKYSKLCEELNKKYDNFDYFGSIPYSKVLELESKTNTISAIYEPSKRNHQLCAPNKFYEALALSKPVIVCRGTGIDKIVEREDIGIVIDYDVQQLYMAIRWLKDHEEEGKDKGKRGEKLYKSIYDWSIMKRKLLNEYEQLF